MTVHKSVETIRGNTVSVNCPIRGLGGKIQTFTQPGETVRRNIVYLLSQFREVLHTDLYRQKCPNNRKKLLIV